MWFPEKPDNQVLRGSLFASPAREVMTVARRPFPRQCPDVPRSVCGHPESDIQAPRLLGGYPCNSYARLTGGPPTRGLAVKWALHQGFAADRAGLDGRCHGPGVETSFPAADMPLARVGRNEALVVRFE